MDARITMERITEDEIINRIERVKASRWGFNLECDLLLEELNEKLNKIVRLKNACISKEKAGTLRR